MRQEVAELLSEDMGEIRDDYSGRGMYGKSTHAVVYDSRGDFESALINAAFEVGARGSDNVEGILGELKNLGTDSMGMGIIVY
jgi:hypothetical protein